MPHQGLAPWTQVHHYSEALAETKGEEAPAPFAAAELLLEEHEGSREDRRALAEVPSDAAAEGLTPQQLLRQEHPAADCLPIV